MLFTPGTTSLPRASAVTSEAAVLVLDDTVSMPQGKPNFLLDRFATNDSNSSENMVTVQYVSWFARL